MTRSAYRAIFELTLNLPLLLTTSSLSSSAVSVSAPSEQHGKNRPCEGACTRSPAESRSLHGCFLSHDKVADFGRRPSRFGLDSLRRSSCGCLGSCFFAVFRCCRLLPFSSATVEGATTSPLPSSSEQAPNAWGHVEAAAQDILISNWSRRRVHGDRQERLSAILQEKTWRSTGDVEHKTEVKAGKLLGVEYVIVNRHGIRIGQERRLDGMAGQARADVASGRSRFTPPIDARGSRRRRAIIWATRRGSPRGRTRVFVNGAGESAVDEAQADKVIRPACARSSPRPREGEVDDRRARRLGRRLRNRGEDRARGRG